MIVFTEINTLFDNDFENKAFKTFLLSYFFTKIVKKILVNSASRNSKKKRLKIT